MQFARLNGITLHYQMLGDSGVKPLIVFINSLGTDFRIWRDVVVRLAGDFAILLYDKRGHGLSDIGPTPYQIDDHAADLAALLDRLGGRPAIVCGLSVGGQVAMALHASRPDLVRSLILCGTGPKLGTAESWGARIAAVQAGGIAAIADGVMKGWLTPAFHAAQPAEVDGYRNMLSRQPVAGYLATCAALAASDFRAIVPLIDVPTLCVTGESDGTATATATAELARAIPGARFEVIAGAAHIPCIEQPEKLSQIIRAFIALAGQEPSSHVTH